MSNGTCSVDGCARPARTRGWCDKHYDRWRRHGDPLVVSDMTRPAAERWLLYADRRSGECWVWQGEIKPNGYGMFAANGRRVYAHRYGYEMLIGPIPAGYQLDHLCRNRACVNPEHLEPVLQRENILRGQGISAQRAKQTHCKRGHELAGANVYRSPSRPNSRICATCVREARRRRWETLNL